jgi:hypothetical protein
MPEIPLTGHFTTNYHTKSISRLIDKGVAEKLPSAKLTKIKSRQLSLFLDIFYPPPQKKNFAGLRKTEFFNSHRRLHSSTLINEVANAEQTGCSGPEHASVAFGSG